MTDKLRNIIARDTIITISIVGPIAAFLDIVDEPTFTQNDKIITYLMLALFVSVGIIRLIRGSILDRKPILSIIIYIAILIPTTAYYSDVRSFYAFFWIIPFYLASFYYSRRVVYACFAVFALAQISKIIIFTHFNYITRFEDYLYLISEFFIVLALSLLVIDTTSVSEEDRMLLLDSLEKTELEQERLSAVMNSIQDGLIAINGSYSIVSFNAAALSILDRHEDILGKDFRSICSLTELDGSLVDVGTLVAAKFMNREFNIFYNDGEKITVAISSVPIVMKSTQTDQGSVLLLRDITKQKSLEEERNAFVSLMSHELRTPLTIAEANISNAEIILRQGNVEKANKAVMSVAREISNLTRITNEFSLVIDLNATPELLQKTEVSLEEVCRELTEKHKPATDEKELVFSAYIAPNTAETLYTNKTYFMHVIDSFTENAIKFTNRGSVTVHFSEQARWLVVAVEDSGAGISKADQQKVFTPFYQSDEYETRSHGGLGVGLYTAKKLADLLGGSVAFTSEKDHGSVFMLRLPLSVVAVPKPLQDNVDHSANSHISPV